MGVPGLFQFFETFTSTKHFSDYRGEILAIDGSNLLHRSAIASAEDVAYDRPSTKYLTFFLNCVKALKRYGITPIFVFDGCTIPAKKSCYDSRRVKRDMSKKA